MVLGWRRAFCTSIPKEKDTKVFSGSNTTTRTAAAATDNNNNTSSGNNSSSANNSPRISSRFGFFSNPSTPRLQSKPVSSPSLRCRTTSTTTTTSSSLPTTPKLHCKTKKTASNYKNPTTNTSPNPSPSPSPRLLQLSSNPSSPKSPSSFSLLKATLRLSKTNRCGICIQNVKTGQGTAIFTAECSHTFHFPCIASHVKNHHILICPVCNSTWKELPLLLNDTPHQDPSQTHPNKPPNITITTGSNSSKALRVYNDDESLLSPTSISRFSAIPESDESNEDLTYEEEEFQGFNVVTGVSCNSAVPQGHFRNVELSLLNEAAVVSANKSYGSTCAVVLKVKAPPFHALRAPIDLVTVLDVSACMNGDKLRMMKRTIRCVLSTLRDSDRLSIVAFSTTSKRLLPLRRMTPTGRRSARRILDAIGCTEQSACVNEALRKAAKVLHDRRERNPVAAMMLLSDGHDQRVHSNSANHKRSSPLVSSTRLGDIPLHAIGFCNRGGWRHALEEDAFAKCINGLLNVVVQDLKLQLGFVSGSDPAEITAVYSLVGRPTALGSGLIRVGDLYAEEERELLVEIKVPGSCGGSCHVMSVGSSYRDPTSRELVYSKEQPLPVPHPRAVRSQTPGIQRLRNLHVTARAIAESRRLVEHHDVSGAYHLLSSARALLVQSGLTSADEFLRCLEAEIAELQRLRQARLGSQQRPTGERERRERTRVEEKPEPLTPTSAWRAAERLAKVAIMRKSMNRVSDLHGFENARF